MNGLESFGFELDFAELRCRNITFSITPEHLNCVSRKRNVAGIACFKSASEHDNSMRQVLITFPLDNVVLRVVSENFVEV